MENSYFGKKVLLFGLFTACGQNLSVDASFGRALAPVVRIGSRNTTTLQERLEAAERVHTSLTLYRKYKDMSPKKLQAEAEKISSLLYPRQGFFNLSFFKIAETPKNPMDRALINNKEKQMQGELNVLYELIDEKAKLKSVDVVQKAPVEQFKPYVNIDPIVEGYQEIAKLAFAQKKIAFENFKATLVALATVGTWLTLDRKVRQHIVSEIAHHEPID